MSEPISPSKKTVAAQLKEAATLLDVLQEDPFRAKAFQSAARNLEAFEGDFTTLFLEDRLTEIRGIGKSLAKDLAALKEQESLPLLLELQVKVPLEVRELFTVSGLGAKKISALWQADITGLAGLIAACEDGRVAAMKGFGQKSAQKFAKAAGFALEAKERMRLDTAEVLAQTLNKIFQEAFPEVKLAVAGELRRALETVGELKLIVSGVELRDIQPLLARVAKSIEEEENTLKAEIEGYKLRLIVCDTQSWGAALAFYTGSHTYVERLQAKAETLGFRLTPLGLFEKDKQLEVKDEEALFRYLDMPWLVPELREATSPPAPKHLIEFGDVRGLVHNHSTWSDAVHSIPEMLAAAIVRGYSYLAMADHSKTSYYANGLSIERVYAQKEEIEAIRQTLLEEGEDFSLLHGLEVDILTDGSLDYPDEVLASLDYVVASVHQNFTLSEKEQTKRIIRAVENPHTKILGHLTGRILLRRPAYALDQQAIIEACAATGTVIEINASPYRLDMDWRWLIKAKEAGCKFSINPDAHHKDSFADVRYGVMVARKAGLSKEDVVNTAPSGKDFLKALKT